jgi:hypothetical protein
MTAKISGVRNPSDEIIDIGSFRFDPGATIVARYAPQIFESELFGLLVSAVSTGILIGVDSHGDMGMESAVCSLNEARCREARREAFTQEELVEVIRADIDEKTHLLIVHGFMYKGLNFPCPLDQQMNFKSTFDMRALLTYPFKVKGEGQNFLMLEDEADVFNWFMTGFQHVHGNLQVGWQMKDDVAALTLQELMSYQDPRA